VKIPRVSSAHVVSALKKRGFTDARYQGKGSHTALIHEDNAGQKLLVIVPKREILPVGTLLSIMKQGKFTREEFIEMLMN